MRQGDDLDVEVRAVDARGRAVDITGAVLSAAAQTAGGAKIASDVYAIDDGPKGYGRVRWAKATTAAFQVGATYSYDIRARLASGDVHTVGEGSFTVKDPRAATP